MIYVYLKMFSRKSARVSSPDNWSYFAIVYSRTSEVLFCRYRQEKKIFVPVIIVLCLYADECSLYRLLWIARMVAYSWLFDGYLPDGEDNYKTLLDYFRIRYK